MLTNIDLDANLMCELDGRALFIVAANRQIEVEAPDVATALKLLRHSSPRGSYASSLRRLKSRLDEMCACIEVRIRGRSLLRIGYGVENRWLGMIGLPQLKLFPTTLLSLVRRGTVQKEARPYSVT